MKNAKVITLPRRKALTLQLDELAGYEGVKLLAGLIQEWVMAPGQHRKIKELAAKAQLTPATVGRIMSRETKSPRLLTCIMIFKALGFTAVRIE